MTFLPLTKSDPQQAQYLNLALEKLAHRFNPKNYSSNTEEVEGLKKAQAEMFFGKPLG